MTTAIDFSKFTFTAEQVRAINELTYDAVISAPEISLIHTIYPNIVTEKFVGFLSEGGLVGLASTGCTPSAQSFQIGSRTIKWSPVEWEVFISQCWKDLRSTMATYSLNTGVNAKDFTSTDYMNVVVDQLTMALKKFLIRFAWFNDTDADNVTGGGVITDGLDLDYFNLVDGLFKQIDTQVTANPAQLVAITENAGVSYVAQKITPANVIGYLQKLVFGAPNKLKGLAGNFILCTQSFYDGYIMALQSDKIQATYTNLVDGMQTVTFNGIPLIALPIWDEMIAEFEDTGAKYHAPNRAVYTNKSVLGLGLDDVNQFETVDAWHSKDKRTVNMEAGGQADVKLMNPDLFMIAK
jgi:hypothetical protein